MKTWLYSWFFYPLALAVGTLWGYFKPKVRQTLELRSWKRHLSLRLHAGDPIEYWVHVASVGELEYAIPLFQELDRLGKKALVTYYSVSAQRPVEALTGQYPSVALTVPLPHDGLGLMTEFVRLVRRQGVRFVLLLKYELWPGLLWECNAAGIKVILAEALRPGWFHKKLLHKLFALLPGYASELEGVHHVRSLVVGDTRVDRVIERLNSQDPRLVSGLRRLLEQNNLLQRRSTLVCGSMWPADQSVFSHGLKKLKEAEKSFFHNVSNLLWLPHELDRKASLQAKNDFEALGFSTFWIVSEDDLARVSLSGGPVALIVFVKGIIV